MIIFCCQNEGKIQIYSQHLVINYTDFFQYFCFRLFPFSELEQQIRLAVHIVSGNLKKIIQVLIKTMEILCTANIYDFICSH